MSRFRSMCLMFAIGGLCSGCGPHEAPVAEMPPPPVSVSQPAQREIVDFDSYEGRIDAVETVEVRARVRGHVLKVHFKDGQIVKAGDLLVEIDPRSYQATLDAAMANKAAAEASLELAKKEFERSAALYKTRAASKEEMDIAEAKQAVADAQRLKSIADIEQAKLDLEFTKITAPIAGKVSRALVTPGNLVNTAGGETLLTTIVTVEPMYVYFDVDERTFLRYRRIFKRPDDKPAGGPVKDLNIPLHVALEGESGYPHSGVCDFADNRVNPATGTIQVRGVLPNAEMLLGSGMRARVRIPVGEPYKALLVSERAIGADQGRKFVYVVNEKDVVERRDVRLGQVMEGLQVVLEGVKADDWVIVNGIQRVREAQQVKPAKVATATAPPPDQNAAASKSETN